MIYPTSAEYPAVPLVSKAMPPFGGLDRTPRQRVMQLLDQAERYRITFLSAAQGFGKTTALADWYGQKKGRGVPIAWFTVDRKDREAYCFWLNFHNALHLALGGRGVRPFEEYVSLPSEQGIYSLANDLSLIGLQEGSIFIVVDCFDLLEGHQSMDELLTLILALSGNVHVVLSSRKSFSRGSFDGFVIPDTPLFIDGYDLAYTSDELAYALEEQEGIVLADQDLAFFHEKTRGWPLAVEMVLRGRWQGGDPLELVRGISGSDDTFWTFFESEVFSRMTERQQELLLKTSSIGIISRRLCEYIFDLDAANELLHDLCVSNLFVRPVSAQRDRYEVHPLFSEWLISKSAFISAEERRRINARASQWYIRHKMIVPAAKHKILSSEKESLLGLVRYYHSEISGKEIMSQVMFRRVPDEASLSPLFCLMAVWAYALSADLESMAYWEQKLRALPESERGIELDRTLDVLEVKRLCLLSNFTEGMKKMASVEPKLQGKDSLPLRLILLNCRAEALDQQGRNREGMEQHRNFESLVGSGSNDFMSFINQYEMAYSLMESGMLAESARVCLSLQASTPADHPVSGAASALSVLVDIIQGVEDDFTERLDAAKDLVSREYNVDMYLDWCVARAWAHFQMGQADKADAILLEAINAVKFNLTAIPRGTAILPFQNRAMMMLMQGRGLEAVEVYREFDMTGHAMTAHSLLVREFVRIVVAGTEAEAPKLAELRERAKAKGYPLLATDLGVQLALIYFERGQRTKACRLLHECLEVAVRCGIVASFALHAERVRPLLVVYLTNAKPDYSRRSFVQGLLRLSAFKAVEDGQGGSLDMVGLTEKEKEILKLAMSGMSRGEIAEELCVGESTVKSHLSHMYRKFGVSKYRDLIAVAAELGS